MAIKAALILVFCVLHEATSVEVESRLSAQLKQHLKKHNLQIPQKDMARRARIFADNLRRIEELSDQHDNQTEFGINQFAHLTYNEFLAKYTSGYTPSLSNSTGSVQIIDVNNATRQKRDNAEVDWRARGKVTGVKNQGQYGACTMFGTNAVIESINAIKRNNLVSLSEQQVVDCIDDYNFSNEFNYAATTGLVREETYPYRASKGTCNVPNGDRVKIDATLMLLENTEYGIEYVLRTYGPMAVAIHVNEAFMYYRGGILTTGDCNDNWHGVAIVGYGSENGQDYWIIKNSWGTGWGENGYIRLRRNQNTCDIIHEPKSAYIK